MSSTTGDTKFASVLFLYRLLREDRCSILIFETLITATGEPEVRSLVEKITAIRGKNIPFFRPKRTLLTTEATLVLSPSLCTLHEVCNTALVRH